MPKSVQVFPWVSNAQYRAGAAEFLDTVRARVSQVRLALVSRGLLTPEEARLGPKLDVRVLDQRSNYTAPLPAIDWRLDR